MTSAALAGAAGLTSGARAADKKEIKVAVVGCGGRGTGGKWKPANAQDFYGEGNVLIAVDMGEYKENDAVSYPEGTMGTLV